MTALTRYDTQALNRALVGFDRLFDTFESRFANQLNNNYPPYNVIRIDDNSYSIELAVAGFKKEEIEVEIAQRILSIRGERHREDVAAQQYLHRGLSARNFERTFQLAEDIVIKGAVLQDGILRVDLERIVPEEKKPKLIDIVEVK
jgi:molecular chaperone IbpA